MAAETQYTANTGIVVISAANSNLDGSTGTVYQVLASPASGVSGTLIKKVFIKAQTNTDHGMVRLFAYDGTSKKLIKEVEVPAITKTAEDPAFETMIQLDLSLVSGGSLWATTEKANTFNVIAEGLDYTYYTASVRPESTNYTANTAMATINAANTGLDGSGTLNTNKWEVLSANGTNGTMIQSVVIKAQATTTSGGSPAMAGMVRLFLIDLSDNFRLISETQVSVVSQSSIARSFSARIDFGGQGFVLQSGMSLGATTERGDIFNVIAEGLDWAYPS